MSAQDHHIVFLSLPITCTGDLWHHAAAQILHSAHRQTRSYDLVTILGAVSEERDFHRSVSRAPSVFDYFGRIGVPCALARISFPDGKESEFSEKMLAVDEQHYMRIMQSQKDCPERFDVLWPKLETISDEAIRQTRGYANQGAPRATILHYFVSTTIAMQTLSLDIDREERRFRLEKLGESLGRVSKDDADIDQDVACKVAQLKSLISQKRSQEGRAFTGARVLLYNWRGPSTYPGHASLPSHLDQISRHARQHGLLVIRVAAGVSKDEIEDTDLDLFSTRVSSAIRDKRFTVRFWSQVSQMPDIFGLIGGRSGSIDVAAFVGLNCFQWDEPVFNIAAGIVKTDATGLPPREYIAMQLPQYLRLVNQCSVVSVGLLDVKSYNSEIGVFMQLMAEELDRWLSGEEHVYPLFPGTKAASDLLVNNIKRIEEPGLGIFATNLRKIWAVAFAEWQ